jgi:hypothetical protein
VGIMAMMPQKRHGAARKSEKKKELVTE